MFQVFSVDKYARQKVIGETDLRVGDVDLNSPIKLWLNLRDLDEVSGHCGTNGWTRLTIRWQVAFRVNIAEAGLVKIEYVCKID